MTSPAKKNALFGQARLDELTENMNPAKPDVFIPYSTKIKRSNYLGLKQASHHLGLMEQEFVDEAIREKLARTPGAEQPLPPAVLAALERKTAKLRD